MGSDHLTAALEVINDFGRVVVCWTISTYNAGDHRATIGDTFKIVAKRIRLQGFIVSDHEDLRSEFTDRVGAWLDRGELIYRETISHGFEAVPDAFAGMLTGSNTGKAIIRLMDDPI